jgi:hypothetical protein
MTATIAEAEAKLAAARAGIARLDRAVEIARDAGWGFDALEDAAGALSEVANAPADADLAALVRGLPERYAMKPAARRALLRSRKVI